MIALNLTTKNGSQQAIKDYLEQNASQILANKINNGARIEKDGKTLINRKDLDGFWAYACNEVQKLKVQYVENQTVFGWAIHYFEEDSIVGILYNEDGTTYTKPIPKTTTHTTPTIAPKPTPPKAQQFSLFDLVSPQKTEEHVLEETQSSEPVQEVIVEETQTTTDLLVDEETGEILSEPTVKKSINIQQASPLYQKYMHFQNQYPQAVIAYRLGDFFEIFGDNAVNVSHRLALTLTGRDCGLEKRIPMIGFPCHAADAYFRKIAEFSQVIVVEDNTVTPYVLEEKTAIVTPIKSKTESNLYKNNEEPDEFKEERTMQQFFDKDVLCVLYELFDYNLDLQ